MSEETLDAGLIDFEAVLGKLAPIGGSASRDRIIFRAGQHSAHRRSLRSGVLGLTLGLAIAFGTSWTLGRMFPLPPELVFVQAPAISNTSVPVEAPEMSSADLASAWQAQTKYFRLQEDLATRGLEALPTPVEVERPEQLSIKQLLGSS
jgi:hypothetical protein